MELDDLKNVWKEEVNMQTSTINFDRIRSEADKFDRKASFGWALEIAACVVVFGFVILWWFKVPDPNPILLLGMIAMVLNTGYVAFKIIKGRKSRTADDWTLATKINIQIEKREQEKALLSSVAYWYLSPIFIAVLLGSYGGYIQRTGNYIPDIALCIYWVVCIALYIGIYFFNQHRVKTKIEPLLEKLRILKQELES